MNGILKEPIQRKIFLLAVVFIATFVVLVVSEGFMDRLSLDGESAIRNQRARRTIGKVILRKLISIELGFGELATTTDHRDVGALNKEIASSVSNIKSALSVLRNGGVYEDVLPANFGNVDEIREYISFSVDKESGYIIEVLELTPKVLDIKQTSVDLVKAVNRNINASNDRERTASRRQIDLLQKQAHAFLLRSRESADRIFYDTNLEIQHLERKQAESIHLYTTVRYIIIATFGLAGIGICVLTIRRIGSIVEERERANEEISKHRNHLAQLVNERTTDLTKANSELIAEIDDRKRAEEALKESQEYLQAIWESHQQTGIMIIDRETHNIIDVNPTAAREFGLPREKIIENICNKFVCSAEVGKCPITDLGAEIDNSERVIVRSDGQQVPVLKTVVPLKIKGRDCLLESFVNISDRKRAEEELRAAQAEVELLLTTIPSIMIGLDRNGLVTLWNHPAEKTFGISADNAMGKAFQELEIDWDWEEVVKQIDRCLEKGIDIQIDEMKSNIPDGTYRILAMKINQVVESSGKVAGVLISGADISERMSLEKQLGQAQKLESIGQLAAGIAHEINTPTQYVGDNTRFLHESFGDLKDVLEKCSEFLTSSTEKDVTAETLDPVREAFEAADVEYLMDEIPRAIEQSLDGIGRVTRIVRAMKSFSHPGIEAKAATDLNKLIESTVTVCRNEWKYVSDLTMTFDESLPPVYCLPGELNQVILNLVMNASQAIQELIGETPEQKGAITVETKLDDEWVEIRIGDSGGGIPEKIASKVFDLFFTTKEAGKGTGQGLSIARDVVVAKHSGSIDFETQDGEGTTFIIRLPVRPPEAAEDNGVKETANAA